ncbi:chalcone isomerase family protein [Parendozoicomonas sp. Alg238-R29]|uniref:chalcone isomerase family protein n=1 Tax=Parendozoicomonas sp. Alg238-R29 TaxID=2993446 RepID=UPI00248D948F|nr:chalcone isomerase family protein [Parendozoicomonas sp. Alg238-R29]
MPLLRFLTLLCCLLSLPTYALTIKGVDIPEVIPATDGRPALKLNGASVRVVYLLVDAYIGELYLENPSRNPEDIYADDGHKRMVFHIMARRVSGRRITSAMNEALELNISPEEMKRHEDKLVQLTEMFKGRLKRGEQGMAEYIPGVGTRVVVKGEDRGIIPGKDFFNALLTVWIGENPVTREFKEDILGVESDKSKEVVTES